jgi:hypothetical protein
MVYEVEEGSKVLRFEDLSVGDWFRVKGTSVPLFLTEFYNDEEESYVVADASGGVTYVDDETEVELLLADCKFTVMR